MQLKIRNVAGVGNAEIKIRGITVIAGPNNTGKSTIGRSLSVVFDSLRRFSDQVAASLHSRDLYNRTTGDQAACDNDPQATIADLVLKEKFNGQPSNAGLASRKSEIALNVGGQKYSIEFADNQVTGVVVPTELNGKIVQLNGTDIGLVDNRQSITVSEPPEMYGEIYDLANEVCPGQVVLSDSRNEYCYVADDMGEILVKDLSCGMRIFAVLKAMLLAGYIGQNDVVVLDDPEAHLHPDWQIKLAKIIALLQQKLGVHVLLITHSPYFLNAIHVFSEKYGIAGKCDYYLSYKGSDGFGFEDVTNDLDRVYDSMSAPFSALRNEAMCSVANP